MSKPSEVPPRGGLTRMFASKFVRYPFYALLGVVGFALLVGGFTETVEATNTLEFCISCHDMRNNYEEYKKTVHYSNRSGIRAVCSDCHVPKRGWFTEMHRKLVAARDVWAEIVGEIDTQEKFDAKRLEMAKREWARMKESDSITCRNCHTLESMDLAAQDKGARNKHTRAALADSAKTCIDCHKGIAHKLPKVQSEEG
jgi:cytochrome c-type protein NapC